MSTAAVGDVGHHGVSGSLAHSVGMIARKVEAEVPKLIAAAQAPSFSQVVSGTVKASGSAEIKQVRRAAEKMTGGTLVPGASPANY